jgi:hypothetical protein
MIRRPKHFATAAGTYTWPRYQLEVDASQPLTLAMVDLPGADYAFDQLGDMPAIRGVGTTTIRYLLVGQPSTIEDEIDNMRRICWRGARGKLVFEDDDGTLRQCDARITAMPQITLGVRDRQRAPVIMTFSQLSDFMNPANTTGLQNITATPQTKNVTSAGNVPVYSGKMTLRGPFNGLVIVNTSMAVPGTAQPYRFATSRVAIAGQWLEINIGANTVRYSNNAGVSWVDDSANVTLQVGQVGLFAFAAGVNAIAITGANGGAVDFDVPGAWA